MITPVSPLSVIEQGSHNINPSCCSARTHAHTNYVPQNVISRSQPLPFMEPKRQATHVQRNITIVVVKKAINITYTECVSTVIVIQHAKRMRRIVLSSVVCLAPPYFSTLSQKRHDFRKEKFTEHNTRFDFLYNFCLKHFSFHEKFRERES